MLEINLEILLLLESVGDCLALHGWGKVLIIRITDFRDKDFITFIAQGHKNSQQPHIDSMIDVNVSDIELKLRLVQILDRRSELRNPRRPAIPVIVLIEDVLS